MKPDNRTWIEGTTKWEGTILVDHKQPLYTNTICIANDEVVDVQSGKQFLILMANFCDPTSDLQPHNVVEAASAHPHTLVESQISHAEMFGLLPEDRDSNFRKRHVGVRDTDTIEKHLTDQ